MHRCRSLFAFALLALTAVLPAVARASQDQPKAAQAAPDLRGLHDFDFLVGDWRVHHRRLKERLAGSTEWQEFEGTCSMRPLMDGASNVDDNVLQLPAGTYRAVGLRAYDSKSATWRIWWLDGRSPEANIDPPVQGRFENGVGTFFADDTMNGKPVRVRFRWSHITPTTARWDQAFSPDGGKTWEVNWEMQFERAH